VRPQKRNIRRIPSTSTSTSTAIVLLVSIATLSESGCHARLLQSAEREELAAQPAPDGDVAYDAADAWPGKGQEPPALTPSDVLRGCAYLADCWSPPEGNDLADLHLCVLAAVFSAERAIPWSGYAGLLSHRGHGYSNERAETALRCAIDAASDCTQVDRCLTDRDVEIYCEEDGCRSTSDYSVSCEGSVAQMTGVAGSGDRDCALASAICDESSETGCTDRPFSACPVEPGTPDWCDGQVLLGCDSGAQVTYRDCSRLGGSCVETPSGDSACLYPGKADPDCIQLPEGSGDVACEGARASACIRGVRIEVNAPEFCLDLKPAD